METTLQEIIEDSLTESSETGWISRVEVQPSDWRQAIAILIDAGTPETGLSYWHEEDSVDNLTGRTGTLFTIEIPDGGRFGHLEARILLLQIEHEAH